MHKVFSSKPQQEYVVKGAMATCMFGVAPALLNTIADNMFVKFNGSLVATTMSLGPVFPTFGVCKMVPSMPKPCACVLAKWDFPDNFVTVNRIAHPLTKMSRGQCVLGTPSCISFSMTGQIPMPGIPGLAPPVVQFQAEATPLAQNVLPKNKVPQLVNVKAYDSDWKRVDEIPEDGYVTLVSDTKNIEVGEEVIFKVDGIGEFKGYVESDKKAYARYCYLGTEEERDNRASNPGDGNTKNSTSSEQSQRPKVKEDTKDRVSDSLIKNKEQETRLNDNLKAVCRDVWDKPNDGFEYDLKHGNLDLKGMDEKEFLAKYKRSSQGVSGIIDPVTKEPARSIDDLSPTEYGDPLSPAIRKNIHDKEKIDKNTVFQKAVCCENLEEWFSRTNNYAKSDKDKKIKIYGSTLVAKDAKHLVTTADLYDGLQLNYGTPPWNPYFPPPPKCVYVVRYTCKNPEAAKIPVHDLNEVPDNTKGYRDPFFGKDNNLYPFRGHGYTPATGKNADGSDRIGTPELLATGQEVDKAIIVRIDPDGSETIVGYKTDVKQPNGEYIPQFVCVDPNGEPVKQLSPEEVDEIDKEKARRDEEYKKVKIERAEKRRKEKAIKQRKEAKKQRKEANKQRKSYKAKKRS